MACSVSRRQSVYLILLMDMALPAQQFCIYDEVITRQRAHQEYLIPALIILKIAIKLNINTIHINDGVHGMTTFVLCTNCYYNTVTMH